MAEGVTQGVRRNWRQFGLQVLTVFAVGLTLGAERTVVPVMGEELFGVESVLVVGSFVVSFGVVKAVMNLYAGKWADAYGRRPVLVAGWLAALPLPLVLLVAPSWEWIALGNVLLGVNQGVVWSTTMIAKIDLASPEERGLAAGIDEALGYGGVAVGGWITGWLAATYGLRPAPFFALAAVIVVATLLALLLVEETRPYARAEAEGAAATDGGSSPAGVESPGFVAIVRRTTVGDRTAFAAVLAGHVQNAVDALVWLAFPLFLAAEGLDTAEIGIVVGAHVGAYVLQLYTGRLGDRIGRKPPIVAGLALAGLGTAGMVVVEGYYAWIAVAGVAGVGMALHYPNLISVVGDVADPLWRSTSLGVYRLWRDLGYATGAIAIGLTVDLVSIEAAFLGTAMAMGCAAGVVALLMAETHPEFGTHDRAGRVTPAQRD